AMHQVEKLLLESPFEAEAIEGLAKLTKEERQQDLEMLRSELHYKNEHKTGGFRWWYAAAAVALIATAFLFLFPPDSADQLNEMAVQQEEPEQVPELSSPDSSDLIAMNERDESPDEETVDGTATETRQVEIKSEDNATEQIVEEIDTPMKNAVSESAQSQIQPPAEAAVALDVEAEAIDEPVQMKLPSEERSKVGRISGEQLPMDGMTGNTLRGRVIMQDGTPLPGVNVAIQGSAKGTTSDIEGYYEIDAPEDATLVFSMLGLEEQEVARPADEELNITMQQDSQVLSEQIVTALSSPESDDISGASPIVGNESYVKYLRENLRYPDSQTEGTVVVQVTIGETGSIIDTKITRSLAPPFDTEAIRLIKEGPIWVPAVQDGNPVIDRVLVKVEFKKD
ncbi:MAG: carboxypeptidase-like regulatory domain-containing protein, partial [Cyclobacteriaceae bacterium]